MPTLPPESNYSCFFEVFAYIWRFIIRNRHLSPSTPSTLTTALVSPSPSTPSTLTTTLVSPCPSTPSTLTTALVSPSPSTPSTLTTALVSPSPSTPSTLTTDKYDVFLSFRGQDTRVGFTSHLHTALKQKQILTFVDDQLVRGDEISASLLRTIEEAKLSVIVFSENYASSKWCLEELVKIFECRKNNGQIVIPVFYKVDPTHVRHQTGSFGDAFARLIRNKALTLEEVQSFRDALTNAANLSGWGLGNSGPESEFIEKIVGDILKKLHAMSSSRSIESCHTTAGLFGIDVRVSKVESLLNINSPDVLIIGIWGMGGIGKTTIAKAVCSKVCSQFEGIFFENFRQQSDLRRKFLKRLLGKETLNTMGYLSFRDSFVRDRLRRIKVFIVLDDVDNSMALEEWRDLLDGRNISFGAGSKVLITSRNKQVLNNVVDETYEVEGLNYEEAIQLFISKALKNCIPTIDQMHLIKKIVGHVQGNPLAIEVLGSSLYGKSIEEWRSALNKLDQDPQIERALRISYDGLDSEQKSIFLDIAHFFVEFDQDEATRILDCLYGRPVIFDISTLIDKCLITNSYFNVLEMHDLLVEMAFNIVRAESDIPGEHSRLCNCIDFPEERWGLYIDTDVIQVLEENKGTQKIKGISLLNTTLSREIHLKPDAFAMMDGLQFLYVARGCFPLKLQERHISSTGLEYLPNKLRYLEWEGFPSKSLPPSFRAEHLVELHLRGSKLVKLWTGVKDVGNLRTIDLSKSPYLTELPDLSMAKNLVSLKLVGCRSLTEVPSSLQYLDKLEKIDLRGCYNLRSFPMLDSKVLRKLSIGRCLDMTTCPTISQNLKCLSLNGCSKMTKFPENLEDMKSLEDLSLSKTGIKEIPLSIKDMVCLQRLDLHGTPIKELPELPPSLKTLTAHDCGSLKTVTSTINIGMKLNFRNCFKLDQKQLIEAMHLKIQSGEEIPNGSIQMVLPGSEIPEWFVDKGIGSSVTIQLPSNCHQLKGVAFCLLFLVPLPFQKVYCIPHVKGKGKNDKHDEVRHFFLWEEQIPTDVLVSCDSYHMILHYEPKLGNQLRKYSGNEVKFTITHCGADPCELKVGICGVYLHFDENIPADKKFKRKFREI